MTHQAKKKRNIRRFFFFQLLYIWLAMSAIRLSSCLPKELGSAIEDFLIDWWLCSWSISVVYTEEINFEPLMQISRSDETPIIFAEAPHPQSPSFLVPSYHHMFQGGCCIDGKKSCGSLVFEGSTLGCTNSRVARAFSTVKRWSFRNR